MAQQYLDSGSNSTDYRKGILWWKNEVIWLWWPKILIKFNEDKAIDKIKDSVYVMIFKNNMIRFPLTLYDWLIEMENCWTITIGQPVILLEY